MTTPQRLFKHGAPHNVLDANIYWNRVWKRIIEIQALQSGLATDGFAVGRMFHRNATVLNGNAFVLPDGRDTYWPLDAFIRQNPAAVDDEFENSCFVPPGTYDLIVIGDAGTGMGIVEWTVDGNVAGTQDWYTTPDSDDPALKILTGIPISQGGWITVSGVVGDKNASSSGYQMPLTKYALRRTGS